jgi:uncharacterized SAM-binding protein YcdF (DUF218 family)
MKALLISPLSLVFLGLAVAWGLSYLGAPVWARRLHALVLSSLFLFSLPLVSDLLRVGLESQTVDKPAEEFPRVDAIVLLGGFSNRGTAAHPDTDLTAAVDRVFRAARLYHAGRASYVLASGGRLAPGDESEAHALSGILQELGVPEDAIFFEEQSTTTAGNAALSAAWLRGRSIRRILLVTSALHMPRARRLFEKQGIDAIPAATDFEVRGPFKWSDLFPNALALDGSARAMKEYIGRVPLLFTRAHQGANGE